MELGALVCTPKSPHCLTCPVMAHCDGRAAGREETLPVKTKAKPPRPEARAALLLEGTGEHAGKVLIRQRPAEGLLARLWELPHTLLPDEAVSGPAGLALAHERLAAHLAEDSLGIGGLTWAMQTDHIFSHIHWKMEVYTARPEEMALSLFSGADLVLPTHYRWIGPQDMGEYAFPNVFIRILNAYFESKPAALT
jgi:A/G-specific adenine glycosylase